MCNFANVLSPTELSVKKIMLKQTTSNGLTPKDFLYSIYGSI